MNSTISKPGSGFNAGQQLIFHYIPNRTVSYIFITLFSIATVLHLFLSIRHRLRWLLPTATFCAAMEVTGWIGRLLASINPSSTSLIPLLLSTLFTLFAPTTLLASNFILLGLLITRLGPCYSRLNPRLYTRIFLSCDIVSLFIQSSGGGLSAINGHPDIQKLGSDLALTGIVFQLGSLIVFTILGTEFFIRYARKIPFQKKVADQYYRGSFTNRIKWMVVGMVAVTSLILIRSVYRSIELAGGYNGKVEATQWLFDVFDATMIVLAIYTLIILHPGRLLVDEREDRAVAVLPRGSDGELQTFSPLESSYALEPRTSKR